MLISPYIVYIDVHISNSHNNMLKHSSQQLWISILNCLSQIQPHSNVFKSDGMHYSVLALRVFKFFWFEVIQFPVPVVLAVIWNDQFTCEKTKFLCC